MSFLISKPRFRCLAWQWIKYRHVSEVGCIIFAVMMSMKKTNADRMCCFCKFWFRKARSLDAWFCAVPRAPDTYTRTQTSAPVKRYARLGISCRLCLTSRRFHALKIFNVVSQLPKCVGKEHIYLYAVKRYKGIAVFSSRSVFIFK